MQATITSTQAIATTHKPSSKIKAAQRWKTPTVILIYRAQILECSLRPQLPYHKPNALNWRFQAPGETYGSARPSIPYRFPSALNWRFRLAAQD
jgi:hypothetical protein